MCVGYVTSGNRIFAEVFPPKTPSSDWEGLYTQACLLSGPPCLLFVSLLFISHQKTRYTLSLSHTLRLIFGLSFFWIKITDSEIVQFKFYIRGRYIYISTKELSILHVSPYGAEGTLDRMRKDWKMFWGCFFFTTDSEWGWGGGGGWLH